jgi:hypothetical protein
MDHHIGFQENAILCKKMAKMAMSTRVNHLKRMHFSARNSSGFDEHVAVLLVGLAVDVVDGVVLQLVRRKERNL